MAKRKNNNYKYKQQKEIEETLKREETFRQKQHKTVVIINLLSILAVIISVVMLILYQNGTFIYGDLVLMFVLAPTMWMQAYRYQTINKKLSKICRIMAIFDAAFFLFSIYSKFFYTQG